MRENNVSVTAHTWIMPMFGNNHSKPYGYVKVNGTLSNGTEIENKFFEIKGGTWDNTIQYIIINRQRYILYNNGTINTPELFIEKWNKTKINGHWVYIK